MVQPRTSSGFISYDGGGERALVRAEDVSDICSLKPKDSLFNDTKDSLFNDTAVHDGQCSFVHVGCTKKQMNGKSRRKHAKEKAAAHSGMLLVHTQRIQRDIISLTNLVATIKEKKTRKPALSVSPKILSEITKPLPIIMDRVNNLEVAVANCQEDIRTVKCEVGWQSEHPALHHPSIILNTLDDIESRNTRDRTNSKENLQKIYEIDRKVEENSKLIGLFANKITALKTVMKDMIEADAQKKTQSAKRGDVYLHAIILPVLPGPYHPSPQSEDYMSSCNGVLLWKISAFRYHFIQAKNGQERVLYSPIFFTDIVGYKVVACIYLNGNGLGQGRYISVYVSILQGTYDKVLPWPFAKKLKFTLIDQSNVKHHVQEYFPEFTDPAFGRPERTMNSPRGFPQFIDRDDLYRSGFVKDDVMFLRISVEDYST